MAEEESASERGAQLREERGTAWWDDAFAGVNEGLDWCFCGGAHPAQVLWRFWRLAQALHCPQTLEYAPLGERLFWEQGLAGGRHRLQLVFPGCDAEEVDWRIRRVLAPALAQARRRSRWEPPHAVERLEDFPCTALWSPPGEEALQRVFAYLFRKGITPGRLLRRVYAFAKWLRPELVLEMSLGDLGKIFGGETRAVQSWRVRQLMNGLLEGMGSSGRATWQRGEATRLRCRQGQLRRKLRNSRLEPAERGQ